MRLKLSKINLNKKIKGSILWSKSNDHIDLRSQTGKNKTIFLWFQIDRNNLVIKKVGSFKK